MEMHHSGKTGHSGVLPVPLKREQADGLSVEVYADRTSMGRAAALAAAERIRSLQRTQAGVRMIFAAAPSQNEFLEALAAQPGIDWAGITAFHMDEYIGLPEEAPQRFGRFLSDRLFDIVHPGQVHLLRGNAPPAEECKRYAELLAERPLDIVCLGIGENGHLAFNDPPVADFLDPLLVKPVELEAACRRQQVNDGCFQSLDEVPAHALTLTIPALLSAAHMYCIVPGQAKREAVARSLRGPVLPSCPASVLRRHPDCTLYLDRDSYPFS